MTLRSVPVGNIRLLVVLQIQNAQMQHHGIASNAHGKLLTSPIHAAKVQILPGQHMPFRLGCRIQIPAIQAAYLVQLYGIQHACRIRHKSVQPHVDPCRIHGRIVHSSGKHSTGATGFPGLCIVNALHGGKVVLIPNAGQSSCLSVLPYIELFFSDVSDPHVIPSCPWHGSADSALCGSVHPAAAPPAWCNRPH